jgi:plastocyanin
MSRLARALSLAFALAALGAPRAFAGEVTIQVGHNKIDPAKVTLAAGDSVVFHNLDAMPGGHTVVADDGSFQSPPLAKDEKWSRSFDKAGSHAIHLKEHPTAKGTIEVK